MKKVFTLTITVFLTTLCAVAQLPYNTEFSKSYFDDNNTTIKKVYASWDEGSRWNKQNRLKFDNGGFDWGDKYIDFKLSQGNVPGILTCKTSNSSLSSDVYFYIATSSDNSNYTTIWSSGSAGNASVELPKDTKYVRICFSGNLSGYYENIKIATATPYSNAPKSNSLVFPDATVGSEESKTSTTMDWCNTPAFNVSLSGDGASQFTCAISNNASTGKYGTATISATYNHDIIGTHKATLTISNGTYTHNIALTGETTYRTQTIIWSDTYSDGKLPMGKEVFDAAESTSKLPITYSSSNENIIAITNNGASFKALAEGSATITASQAGDAEWGDVFSTKKFTVTSKKIQSIVWEDNLTRLKTGDTITLKAKVQILVNAETGEKEDNAERTARLTYTSANKKVVSISGNVLTTVGEGETTLTASIEGNEYFEAASVTVPVKVRVPSAGCEDILLLEDNAEAELFSSSLSKPELATSAYAINKVNGIPGQLHFQHKGEKYWTGNYNGTIKVQQSSNGGSNWSDVEGSSVEPTVGTYTSHSVTLNRNTTHIRFVRPQGGEGYHYVSNIVVTPAQYLETSISSFTDDAIVGDIISENIIINYANVKDEVLINHTNEDVTLSTTGLGNDCGDFGSATLALTVIPTAVGTITDEIVISDAISGMKVTIPVTINVNRNTQTITWNQDIANILTTDNITFNAEAKTNITYKSSNTDIAEVQGNQLVIKTSGEVTITATAVQNEKYEATTATKTIVITKATPAVISLPTVDPITYGTTLQDATLNGGQTDTEGTWQWNADLTQVLNAGTHELAVQFIPTNTAWFNTLDSKVTVTINKAAQTITWDFTDQEITVGTTLTLNASATFGEVTFSIEDNGVASLEGNTLTAIKAGTVTITASQAGNDNYAAADSITHTVTVNKATPIITTMPTLASVVYGATLREALTLVGGEATVNGVTVEGEFTFVLPTHADYLDQVPTVGEHTFDITFLPVATECYNEVDTVITLLVTKELQTITWDFADQEVLIGTTLNLNATATSGEVTFSIECEEGVASLEGNTVTALKAGVVTITAFVSGNENYEPATVSHVVTVIKHTPTIVALPTVAPVEKGTALNDEMLVGGEANTDGTWTFVDASLNLDFGSNNVAVRFTPSNLDYYTTIDTTIIVDITKKQQTIEWELESTTITIGEEIDLSYVSSTSEGNITFTFDKEGIVKLDTDFMILVAINEGTVTVTATQEGDNEYAPATLSYTINVVDPNSSTTGVTNNNVMNEKSQKTFINGQVYIIKSGIKYNVLGAQVK